MSDLSATRLRGLPWQSRYAWEVRHGLTHPTYTYDTHPDVEAAESSAMFMLRMQAERGSASLVLSAVHVKGPEGVEPDWRRIELRC